MRKLLEMDSMALAGEIIRASDDTVWEVFSALRRERRLSAFVADMNSNLRNESRRDLALATLRRFGLEHAG